MMSRQHLSLAAAAIAVTSILAAGITLGVAWVISRRVDREAFRPALRRPFAEAEVVHVAGRRLRLRQHGRRPLRTAGTWGFAWSSGYARLTDPQVEPDATVSYTFEPLTGMPSAGEFGRIDSAAFSDEHQGLEVCSIPSAAAALPARIAHGDGARWVILVHGQSGGMREVYRLEAVARATGATTLVISYRNDPGAPPTEDGLYHFGRSEWEDLEAAVRFARSNGARDIALTGHSMGAAILLRFMEHSALSHCVRAAILDAPLLDLRSAAAWTAHTTGVPRAIIPIALKMAALRLRISWTEFDARAAAANVPIPMLVFHGERDGQVPLALSEGLARSRPHNVVLERVAGAGHGQCWNLAPAEYERAAMAFLATHLMPQPSEHRIERVDVTSTAGLPDAVS